MWTQDDLAQAFSLKDLILSGGGCTGVSIDSRTIQKGDLFIALKGENSDGHAYVKEALSKGASAAIVQEHYDYLPSAKQIVVLSTQRAMEQLAEFARKRTNAKITAITGSAGKTTVKEFLAFILKQFGKTVYSRASYNNAIGVPYSLAHLEDGTDYGVFEIGMNNPGEIAPLVTMVRPHLAIITSIGESHIGRMGSEEAIAEEKSEVLRGLNASGAAILPYDTTYFKRLFNKAQSFGLGHILTFGKKQGAYAQLLGFSPNDQGTGSDVVARIGDKEYTYTIHIPGEHSALNSLIILLACEVLGLQLKDVLKFLATFSPVQGRGLRHIIPVKSGHMTLIDDAYNANPSSMRAGLSVLALTQPTGKGRKIAVLGDMKELGEGSAGYHKALALVIDALGVDLVFASGNEMKHLYDCLSLDKRGGYAETVEGLVPKVVRAVHEGDVVFVKGSKSSYISKIVDAFLR